MRVFVTGATGWIGSAVVQDLLEAGHDVVGLARSDEGAAALAGAGVEVIRGSLEDPDGLHAAAAAADGVIHTAYIHDFSRMPEAAQTDLRAIEAIGSALAGSDRPFVMTTGTALVAPGQVATENDRRGPGEGVHPRVACENAGLALARRGVRVSVVRPAPSVHGDGDKGFIPFLIGIARERGVAGYVGDGSNRWPGVHRFDAARLYRLGLEQGPAGSVFHAIADEGVPTREIAEVLSRQLEIPAVSISPEDAPAHFDWMAMFWSLDIPASSALTRQQLGWTPTHPGLIEDLEQGHYFAQVPSAAA